MEDASEGELHEPLARQATELCRKAGAGPETIPKVDRRGAQAEDAAHMPPFPGGLHDGGVPRRSCGRYTVSGGCASVTSWKSPQDEIDPVQGT